MHVFVEILILHALKLYLCIEMKIYITEVQITCIVLMGLITLLLAKFLPAYVNFGRKIHVARKFLTYGTLLITVHFIIQYFLHKNLHDVAEIRTIVNLLFGIPISYFFNISYLYLMQQGNIRRRNWWIGPIALILSFTVLFISMVAMIQHHELPYTTIIMSLIYGTTLIYYKVELIKAFFKAKKEIAEHKNPALSQLIEWTRWSLLILVLVAFGFPFMTFCTNHILRSVYGILAISSSFFYIVSFIGYCLTNSNKVEQNEANVVEKPVFSNETTSMSIIEPTEKMNAIIQDFIQKESYTIAGITLKDAAIEMGISCNKLRVWLRGTPYEKFNNWIVSLRIEKSKKLLIKNPDLSNEEIAEQCGFCDRQYFQHQFSKKEGVTPTRWQREHTTNMPTCPSSLVPPSSN